MTELLAKYLEIISVWCLMILGMYETVTIISKLLHTTPTEYYVILFAWTFGAIGMLLHITKLIYKD